MLVVDAMLGIGIERAEGRSMPRCAAIRSGASIGAGVSPVTQMLLT
jgi:hypothetical protein